MNKQTAVEWVIQKLIGSGYLTQGPSNTVNGLKVKRMINQAKAMEREQIEEAYNDGCEERHNEPVNGEQYYNETFQSMQP